MVKVDDSGGTSKAISAEAPPRSKEPTVWTLSYSEWRREGEGGRRRGKERERERERGK